MEQPKARPEFNQRDIAFMEARPGLQHSPELAAAVQMLAERGVRWPSEHFYGALESIFPVQPPKAPAAGNGQASDIPAGSPEVRRGMSPPADALAYSQLPEDERVIADARQPHPIEEQIRADARSGDPSAAYVSAPPHREAPSYTSGERPLSQTSVKLSPNEREIARLSGISEAEFARQKLKLQRYKASGLIVDEG
jgi:hypothetical protein